MASESSLYDSTSESDIHDSKKRKNNHDSNNNDNRTVIKGADYIPPLVQSADYTLSQSSPTPKSLFSESSDPTVDPAKSSDIFYVWAKDEYEDTIKRNDLFESLKLLKFTSEQINASIDEQNILEEKVTILTMKDHVNVMKRLIEKYNLSVPSYNKYSCYHYSKNEATHSIQEIYQDAFEYSHILSFNRWFKPCQTYYYRYNWWYLLKNGVPLFNSSVIDALVASRDAFTVEGDRTPMTPQPDLNKERIAKALQSIEKLIDSMEYKENEFEKLLKTEHTWWVICGWCRIFKCSSKKLRLLLLRFLNTFHPQLRAIEIDPPVVNMDNYIDQYLKQMTREEFEQRLFSSPIYKNHTTFELLCMFLKFSPYLTGSTDMIHQIILDGELLSLQVGQPVITIS